MTLRDFIINFYPHADYRLVGARTGKELLKSWNASSERKKKYMDKQVSLIYPDIRQSKAKIFGDTDYFYPCITISIMGE
ncbi:MAG TPA: hypothetical protein O0X50_01765 [Methanocorpusculum sp.]|nr:hypothetical protein [Methanocorpusculum sp.]